MSENLQAVFVKEDLDRDDLDPETSRQNLFLPHMNEKHIQFSREFLFQFRPGSGSSYRRGHNPGAQIQP